MTLFATGHVDGLPNIANKAIMPNTNAVLDVFIVTGLGDGNGCSSRYFAQYHRAMIAAPQIIVIKMINPHSFGLMTFSLRLHAALPRAL